MKRENELKIAMDSLSVNIGIVRLTAAAFAAQKNLTLSEIDEVKVAVSEALSNSIIHGYAKQSGIVELLMRSYDDRLEFIVKDTGCGIADVDKARQPSYSSDPERMGLGFAFMESFMDSLTVESGIGTGTIVTMVKYASDRQEE